MSEEFFAFPPGPGSPFSALLIETLDKHFASQPNANFSIIAPKYDAFASVNAPIHYAPR